MNRIGAIGMCAVCAGFLAVGQVQTRSVSETTTWNGTLVDATCQSSHTVHRQTTTTRSGDSVTTQTDTTRTMTACPVTSATTTFGVITKNGRFVRFDDASNARVLQMVRDNQTWNQGISERRPLEVQIVGTPDGDMAVVQSMVPYGTHAAVGEANRMANLEQTYDVRWHGDRGRLIVGTNTISFQDLTDGKHSRTWNYAQIRELKRDSGKEIKIEPYDGDKYELHLTGSSEMADNVYNMIGDRIVAARTH